jgi:cell fate regulator YaaT (PSP1 superfamily)
MHVVIVEHQKGGKRYVFDCTKLKKFIKKNDTVICETSYGEQLGTAVSNPICVNDEVNEILELYGARFPLKNIVGIVQTKERVLTEKEKELIAIEYIGKKIQEAILDCF